MTPVEQPFTTAPWSSPGAPAAASAWPSRWARPSTAPTSCCSPRPPNPHPKLTGTVYTAVEEIEAAGGKAAAVVGDVRNEEDVQRAVDTAVERFGGVDICVNNASAIATDPTEQRGARPRSST